MNITDLTARIKFNIETSDLKKFSDGLDDLKKRLKELEKSFNDTQKAQKEAKDADEKAKKEKQFLTEANRQLIKTNNELSQSTEKASVSVEKHHHSYRGLSIILQGILKLFKAFGYVARITWSGISHIFSGLKWATAGTAASLAVLDRMMKSAGSYGNSMKIMSTDFGVSPEALQSWQALAERAGSSSDVMNRTLGFMENLKRTAVANPYFIPDVLNLAGIRPAVYQDAESLMKAIMSKTRGMDQRKRLAFFERLGVSDAAEFDMIAQEWAKNGFGTSNAALVSNANIEKLNKVKIAFREMTRLTAAIKNNILASFSESFIEGMDWLSRIIKTSVAVVEGFIAKHGGIKKVLGDISPVISKIYGLTGAFTAISGVLAKFGVFAGTLVVLASGLGVILYLARSIVKAFKEAVGFAGSLKELLYGFAAFKLGELLDSGDIPPEYRDEVSKAQQFFLAGAGQFKDQGLLKNTISKITGSLDNLPKKIGQILKSVLSDLMTTFINTFVEKILALWADSEIVGSDFAKKALKKIYNSPNFVPNKEQEDRMKRWFDEGVASAMFETEPDILEENPIVGKQTVGDRANKAAVLLERLLGDTKMSDLRKFIGTDPENQQTNLGYISGLLSTMYKGVGKGLYPRGNSIINTFEYHYNIDGSNRSPEAIASAIRNTDGRPSQYDKDTAKALAASFRG